jgi:hypothetical protein
MSFDNDQTAEVLNNRPRRSRKVAKPEVAVPAAPIESPKPVKPKSPPKPKKQPVNDNTKSYAKFGVIFMASLSAVLNGYSNSQHAPEPLFGWMMGFAVPIIVLVLSKIAGNKWKKGQRHMAYLSGGSGSLLLLLSVWHCAQSIAMLTGSDYLLSIPMAIAIDLGLVSCELALVTEE